MDVLEKKTVVSDAAPYEPKGLAAALDAFFHFRERGGTMKGEVLAGVSAFLVSVCVLLMNTRIIGEAVGADNLGYRGIYMAAAIVSFLGTLAIGLIARLPLIQTASLGLSTAFISLIGAGNGLTYQNLLAISLVSSIVYTILVSVPGVKRYVYEALPSPVRKALPVGMGLYIVFFALKDAGFITVAAGSVTAAARSGMANGMISVGTIAAAAAALACFICYRLKKYVAAPVFFGLVIGLVCFYVCGLFVGFSLIFSVNRAYIAVGAENMFTIAAGFAGLDIGSVFKQGFDFSAYTGNVAQLFISGVLTFFFMSMYESEAGLGGASLYNDAIPADGGTACRVLAVNAVTNVAAPIFGALPVTVAKQSAAASHDGGKSGLTSVVAALGYLLAMCTWIFFALLATYTAAVSDYGHATSNSYAEYAQAAFAVVDGVMIFIGILMLKGIRGIDADHLSESLPFFATAAITAGMQNIVYGAAAGLLVYIAVRLFSLDKEEVKRISAPTVLLTVLILAALALA